MIDLKQNTLLREIPDNLLIDEKVVNLAKALQVPLSNMLEWANKINYTINLDLVDEEILDHLLWEKHIGWSEGLLFATTREQKINLIQAAIDIHRHKGTPYAIERVLEALNINGKVAEWFEYGGSPYFFRLETNQPLTIDTDVNRIVTLVNSAKNARSWLENITVNRELDMGLNIGSAVSNYQITTIHPPAFAMPDLNQGNSYAGVVTKYNTTIIETPPFKMPNFEISHSIGGAFSCWKQTTILPKEVV